MDRFVLSEPLAIVPYSDIYYWQGQAKPGCRLRRSRPLRGQGYIGFAGAGGLHRRSAEQRQVEVGTRGAPSLRRDT